MNNLLRPEFVIMDYLIYAVYISFCEPLEIHDHIYASTLWLLLAITCTDIINYTLMYLLSKNVQNLYKTEWPDLIEIWETGSALNTCRI